MWVQTDKEKKDLSLGSWSAQDKKIRKCKQKLCCMNLMFLAQQFI